MKTGLFSVETIPLSFATAFYGNCIKMEHMALAWTEASVHRTVALHTLTKLHILVHFVVARLVLVLGLSLLDLLFDGSTHKPSAAPEKKPS